MQAFFFLARHVSKNVTGSLDYLKGLITKQDAILQDRSEDVSEKLEMDENSSKTIAGGSPCSKLFRKICDVTAVLEDEEQHQSAESPYYCPDVVTFLLTYGDRRVTTSFSRKLQNKRHKLMWKTGLVL